MANIDINKRIENKNYSMNQLHSHPNYEIYFLLKGNRLIFFADKIYEVSKPSIFIIPPETLHKTEGGPFIRYTISIEPKSLNKFQQFVFNQKQQKPIEISGNTLDTLSKLFEEATNLKYGKYKTDITETIVAYIIYVISKISVKDLGKHTQNKNNVPPNILKIMHYINNNVTENITLDDISQKFYIAKSTLNYNFKHYVSCTPIEYLLTLRLDMAKRLLLETDKSIEKISEECGFSSSNYFGTIFKKHLGISPKSYRKNER